MEYKMKGRKGEMIYSQKTDLMIICQLNCFYLLIKTSSLYLQALFMIGKSQSSTERDSFWGQIFTSFPFFATFLLCIFEQSQFVCVFESALGYISWSKSYKLSTKQHMQFTNFFLSMCYELNVTYMPRLYVSQHIYIFLYISYYIYLYIHTDKNYSVCQIENVRS